MNEITFEEIEDRVRLLAVQRNLGWGDEDIRLLAQDVHEVMEEKTERARRLGVGKPTQYILEKVTEYMDWIVKEGQIGPYKDAGKHK